MTFDEFREMSEKDLEKLGANEIAYVRPIIVDNRTQFMVMAGDGRELGIAPDYTTAVTAALRNWS